MTVMMLLAGCSPSSSSDSTQTFETANQDSNSNNIVGGVQSTAEYQKANGIAGLLIITENALGQQSSSVCTASLIAPNVALTAAHCILLSPGSELVAALIVLDTDFSKVLQEINNDDLSHVRVINGVKRHEAYMQGRGTNNDIGLVSFEGELPATFQLAQMATTQLTRTIRKGDTVTLSGFGVSQYQWNRSTGKPTGSGSGLLRQIDGIKILSLTATGEEITLDQSQGRGACHGDSGGPAYLKDKATGKNILFGVTSRGTNPQGLCDRQAIYTGLMGYVDWIQAGIKELSAPAAPEVPDTPIAVGQTSAGSGNASGHATGQ